MAYLNKNENIQKFLPKMTVMDSYQIYLNQVSAAMETLRSSRDEQAYIPAQLGGVYGQRLALESSPVLQLTTFEIK